MLTEAGLPIHAQASGEFDYQRGYGASVNAAFAYPRVLPSSASTTFRWRLGTPDDIVITIFDQRDKHSDAGTALSRHDAELGQVAAQGVHKHCPLPDQKLADPMQHQHTRLLFALHRNEAHSWPRHRLADRLGSVASFFCRFT